MVQGMKDPLSLPAIQINGYGASASIPNTIVGGVIGATDLIRFGNNTYSLMGSVSKNLANHTFKFGGENRRIQFNYLQTGDAATNFNFSPQWTQGPNPTQSSAVAGLGLASFLLGIPTGGVNPAPALAMTMKYYALLPAGCVEGHAKPDCQLGRPIRLRDTANRPIQPALNFDYNAASPLAAPGLDLRGGLTFVGVGGVSRFNAEPDRNNFAPRLGISYKITPKTIIRAGARVVLCIDFGCRRRRRSVRSERLPGGNQHCRESRWSDSDRAAAAILILADASTSRPVLTGAGHSAGTEHSVLRPRQHDAVQHAVELHHPA